MPVIFGDNIRINCGNDASLQLTGTFTIAVFAKVNASGNNRGFFDRHDGDGDGYFMGIHTSDKMIYYADAWALSTNTITEGVWSWFFYVYDGVNMNFYQDLVSKLPAAIVAARAVDTDAAIGGNKDNTFDMDGIIGEVYVWDGVELSAVERALLVNANIKGLGLQIQPAALKGYWSLDDHPDGTALVNEVFTDKSGIGNNGTTNGGTMEAEKNLSYQ